MEIHIDQMKDSKLIAQKRKPLWNILIVEESMYKKWILELLIVITFVLIGCNTESAMYRAVTNGYPNPQTNKIFPERKVENAPPISQIKKNDTASIPIKLTFQTVNGLDSSSFNELLKKTRTEAFIVIKDNEVIYENYLNGTTRESVHTSFSVAKSIVSTLIGIAIEEGKILSVNDPVIKYIPELKDSGLDSLTIHDMLIMSSGIDYRRFEDTFFLLIPFSPDLTTFYGDNLRNSILNLHSGKNPIGKFFNYNDFYPLIEGMILERVTGMSISQYTQKKIWEPMGMEFEASWSLDKADSGFEKTNVAFNARTIDFARFGLLFLNHGTWNGHRIVSEDWVNAATSPDPNDKREWKVFQFWPTLGGYYKFHWWGMRNDDNTFDYMARGNLGQLIYVSPSRNTVVVRLGDEPDNNYQWPFIVRALLDQIK
jgi:CubicO group peptidase (beta-lactamase class C family)